MLEFIERMLDAEAHAQVATHIQSCPECGEVLSELELARKTDPSARFGRYLKIREIGAGAMGVVYEAHDPLLSRKVALKVLRDSVASDQDAELETHLFREAKALARLAHPNVVAV